MIILDKMHPSDWNAVKRIYEEGIATGNATFQQQAPGWKKWNNDHLQHSRIIAKEDDTILGWGRSRRFPEDVYIQELRR